MYIGVPATFSIIVQASVKVASPKSETLMLNWSSGSFRERRMFSGCIFLANIILNKEANTHFDVSMNYAVIMKVCYPKKGASVFRLPIEQYKRH